MGKERVWEHTIQRLVQQHPKKGAQLSHSSKFAVHCVASTSHPGGGKHCETSLKLAGEIVVVFCRQFIGGNGIFLSCKEAGLQVFERTSR